MVIRVLLAGNEQSAELHESCRNRTDFLSRIIPLSDLSPKQIKSFRPDIVVVESDELSDYQKLLDRLRAEDSAQEAAIVAMIDEEAFEARAQDLPVVLQDVLLKPLNDREALARLLLAYRRTHRMTDKSVIRTGDLEIDISRYEVRVAGGKVDLTYTEYELLKFLASHPGQVFSRDALLNKVWGYDYFGGARTVDVHVRRLRAKIEVKTTYIETLRNIGYKFVLQEENE